MNEYSKFQKTVTQTARKIMGEVANNPQVSSWQLKNKLQVSSSRLYMALGYLISQNKITVTPEGMSYKITPLTATTAKTEH
jgi:hypothetical protein